MTLTFSFSLLTLLLAATTTATDLSYFTKPTTADCTSEVVSFSACLPYTALPPNNLASSVSTNCCENFSGILAAGNGSCLCSLLIEPPIFGFPLNFTRIISLSSVCPLPSRLKNVTLLRNHTLQSVCSALEASPPLLSPEQGSRNQSDSNELSPRSIGALPSFHSNDLKPRTDKDSFLAPSPSRRFHFGSSQVSSAISIIKIRSWILPMSSLCLIV